jgi:hypothetical protein
MISARFIAGEFRRENQCILALSEKEFSSFINFAKKSRCNFVFEAVNRVQILRASECHIEVLDQSIL